MSKYSFPVLPSSQVESPHSSIESSLSPMACYGCSDCPTPLSTPSQAVEVQEGSGNETQLSKVPRGSDSDLLNSTVVKDVGEVLLDKGIWRLLGYLERIHPPYHLDLITGVRVSVLVAWAAVTLVLVMLMFAVLNQVYGLTHNSIPQISWGSRPPKQWIFAMPCPNISIFVTDGDNTPEVGVVVNLSAIPVGTFAVNVPINNNDYYIRSINCLDLLNEGQSVEHIFESDNSVVCHAAKSNFQAVTDVYGMAVFTNFTIVSGLPGAWAIIPSISLDNYVYMGSARYITMSSPLIEIDAQYTTIPSQYDQPFSVSATIKFQRTWDKPSHQYYPDEYLQGAEVSVVGITLDGSQWMRPDLYPRNDGPLIPSLSGPKLVFLQDNVYSVQPEDIYINTSAHAVSAIVEFPSVKVMSSSDQYCYLAVQCMGTFALLPNIFGKSTISPNLQMVDPSLKLTTTVAQLMVKTAPAPSRLQEGIAFSTQPTVCTLNSGGSGVAGKFIVARIMAKDGIQMPSFKMTSDEQYALTPGYKFLLGSISGPTDSYGCTTFTNLGFSYSGPAGLYTIGFQSDGVTGPDVVFDFTVLSAVQKVLLRMDIIQDPAGPWSTNGTVLTGQRWEVVPNCRLLDGNGQPVPNKEVTLQAPSPNISVAAISLASDSSGWVYFSSVVVHYATVPGHYIFLIVVDGTVHMSFTRYVDWDASSGSQQCAFVKVASYPLCAVVGHPLFGLNSSSLSSAVKDLCPGHLDFQVLNYKGEVLHGYNVFIVVLFMYGLLPPVILYDMKDGTPAPRVDGVQYVGPTTDFASLAFLEGFTGPVRLGFACHFPGQRFNTEMVTTGVITLQVYQFLDDFTFVPIAGTRRAALQVTTLPTPNGTLWPLSGILLNATVVGMPLYVERYYGNEVAYTNQPHTNDNGVAVMELLFNSTNVFAKELGGTYSIALHVLGLPATTIWNLSLAMPVTGIDIIAPAIPANGTAVQVDQFTDTYTTILRAPSPAANGSRVEPRILVCDGPPASCPSSDPTKWHALLPLLYPRRYGRPQVSTWDGRIALQWPPLSTVGFNDLQLLTIRFTLIGALPGYTFRFAYAYGGVVLANETGVFQATTANVITITDQPSFLCSPGKKVKKVVLEIQAPKNLPPLYTFAIASVDNETQLAAGLEEDGIIAVGKDGRVEFTNLVFLPSTAIGLYRLEFSYPGASSVLTSKVAVTQQLGSIFLANEPPTAALVKGSTINLLVGAMLSDASPVSNIIITCYLVMSEDTKGAINQFNFNTSMPYEGCYAPGGNCGALFPPSSQRATDAGGLAKLQLVIVAAYPGSYQIECIGQVPSGEVKIISSSFPVPTNISPSLLEQLGYPTNVSIQQALGQSQSSSTSTDTSSSSSADTSSTSTGDIEIYNNVKWVLISVPPLMYPADYRPPIKFDLRKPDTTPVLFYQQPRVQILDWNGNPLSQRQVYPAVFPNFNLTWDETMVSDNMGYYQFRELSGQRPESGDYQMVFFVDGIPSNGSSTFTVPGGKSNSTQFKDLRYALLSLYLILLPLFIANYPGHRLFGIWVALGIMSVAGAGCFVYFIYWELPLANWGIAVIWVQLATAYFITTYAILGIAALWMALKLWLMDRKETIRHNVWGITLAQEQYSYVKWLVNLKLTPEERSKLLDEEAADPMAIHHMPPKELTKHIVPFRFYLSLGLCAWLILSFMAFCVQIFLNLHDFFFSLARRLPPIPELSAAQVELAKQKMEAALIQAIDELVAINPVFAVLYRMVPLLYSLNLINTIKVLTTWAEELEQSTLIGGGIAVAFCLFFSLLNCALMFLNVKKNILRIRKFKDNPVMRGLAAQDTAENFAANQLYHILLGYVFQFYIFFVIFTLLSTPSVWRWLWENFANTVIILLVTSVTRKILAALMKRIALDGLELLHPEWYHFWANFNFVFMAMIAAVTTVIIRFVESICNVSVFFVRLDVQLFHGILLKLDSPHASYHAMLYVENNFHNPIRTVFLAYLLQNRCTLDTKLHPSIKAMIVILMKSSDPGIHLYSALRRKWWLAVMLIQNPQLRLMRKHATWPRFKKVSVVKKAMAKVRCKEPPEPEPYEPPKPLTPKEKLKQKRKQWVLFLVFIIFFFGWLCMLLFFYS